jgi:hypothetical protein
VVEEQQHDPMIAPATPIRGLGAGAIPWRRWRRYWPLFLVITATFAVVLVLVVVDWSTREWPNYSRIEDGLYVGGYVREPPPGVTAVLNLCETEDRYRARIHRWEPIHDAAPAPSIDWLREQVQFIDTQRRAGKTMYVHCHAGISRGAMVTAAYLMWRNDWTREEALSYIRKQRPAVRPNPAFMVLLQEWEQALHRDQPAP